MQAVAAGVDKLTFQASTSWAWKIVRHLSAAVLSGRYFPQDTRNIRIQKESRGVRIIQIPTVADRTLGTAIGCALKPLFVNSLRNFYGRSRETLLARIEAGSGSKQPPLPAAG